MGFVYIYRLDLDTMCISPAKKLPAHYELQLIKHNRIPYTEIIFRCIMLYFHYSERNKQIKLNIQLSVDIQIIYSMRNILKKWWQF